MTTMGPYSVFQLAVPLITKVFMSSRFFRNTLPILISNAKVLKYLVNLVMLVG